MRTGEHRAIKRRAFCASATNSQQPTRPCLLLVTKFITTSLAAAIMANSARLHAAIPAEVSTILLDICFCLPAFHLCLPCGRTGTWASLTDSAREGAERLNNWDNNRLLTRRCRCSSREVQSLTNGGSAAFHLCLPCGRTGTWASLTDSAREGAERSNDWDSNRLSTWRCRCRREVQSLTNGSTCLISPK